MGFPICFWATLLLKLAALFVGQAESKQLHAGIDYPVPLQPGPR
jgi:hypothetical protein